MVLGSVFFMVAASLLSKVPSRATIEKYFPTRPSIFRCEYRFEKLEPSRLSSVWTKMLFLAPRDSEFFQELARALPDALARPLRPRNAREFLRDVLR